MEKKKKIIDIEINKEYCKACLFCIDSCPKQCLIMGTELNSTGFTSPVFVNQGNCTGCAICSLLCPDMAIQVFEILN